MTSSENGPVRSVCIVMLSAIGDAVHVLPVANALKRAWPDVRISWIIQHTPKTLVEGHPAIDEMIEFEKRRRGLRSWTNFADLAHYLRGQHFDLALALQVYLKAGIIVGMLPAKRKLGFDHARARDGNWIFTNERIPHHSPQHVQEQYFEFLHHLGVDPEPVEWGIPITDQEREAQGSFFSELDKPACSVVVSTTDPRKNWTAEGYARVLEEIESTYGLQTHSRRWIFPARTPDGGRDSQLDEGPSPRRPRGRRSPPRLSPRRKRLDCQPRHRTFTYQSGPRDARRQVSTGTRIQNARGPTAVTTTSWSTVMQSFQARNIRFLLSIETA